jgi:hypothetical protein
MRWDAGWCWFSLLFTEPITSGAPQGKLPIFISQQKAAGKYKKQRGGRPAPLSSLYHILDRPVIKHGYIIVSQDMHFHGLFIASSPEYILETLTG